MVKTHLCFAAAALILVATASQTSWGRGFGGMHGGAHFGGMHGGAHFGGAHIGGAHFGGAHIGGAHLGGSMAFGGAHFGGAHFGGSMAFGGSARGGIGHLGGARIGGISGTRMGGYGGYRGYGGARIGGVGLGASAYRAGGLNRDNLRSNAFSRPSGYGFRDSGYDSLASRGFPGGVNRGFGGMKPDLGNLARREPGLGGERRPGEVGPVRPGVAVGRPGDRQLGKFLGLPSDHGLHRLAANRIGAGRGPLSRRSDLDRRRIGDHVRLGFHGRGFYSTGWYRRYPGAWYPGGWAYGSVWAAATWTYLNTWFDYDNEAPIYYDYGNTVVYQDNSVYVDGQDVGTADEYYQQAQDLADTGAEATSDDDAKQWLPLGVFAMTHDNQTSSNLVLQLAVNKAGIIRGNYTSTITNDTKPVQGSVDKKTQRAAFTIGDNKQNVIETGIYNLTKDQVPVLVHFGKDKTEQWLLVRLKQNEQQAGQQDDKQQDQKPQDASGK